MSAEPRFLSPARTVGTLTALLGVGFVIACSPEIEPTDPIGVGGAGAAGGSTGGTGLTSGTGGTTAGTGGSGGVGGGSGGTGGAAGSSVGGSAGSSGAGGTSAGSAGSAGAAGGGQAGDGGASGTAGAGAGGASSGGMSGSGAGGASSGGMSGGGAGGASSGGKGGSGGSGGKAAADPSAGCGKMNPQLGSSGSPLMVSGHQYYMKVPSGYDASKPYPVMFMFNPTNNPISWAEQSAGFEQNGAKDAWIRVYPHPANSSAGWNGSDVSFFEPLYNAVTNALCVDKARVFAAGESSGGDFSSILGCEHGNKLTGIGPCATKPVNGYPLNAGQRTCTGPVDAVIIHGKNDSVVGTANGPATRDFYVDVNNCTSMTMPVQGYTDTLSNCIEYQGCDAGTAVVWCQHTDPNYSNTNHGWPAFADNYLFERFSKY
jgi:polyhydroxybutyrate depolymerase